MSNLILGDNLGRAWIELSGVNPVLVDQYKPSLVSFLAFDRGHNAQFVGTGFVICGNSEVAIVVTARHVLEGVSQVQNPGHSVVTSLRPDDLKAVWMGGESAAFLNIIHQCSNSETDVAICIIVPQETTSQPFAPISVPLHPIMPSVGQTIEMVSVDEIRLTELVPPVDKSWINQQLNIFRRLSIRVGTVTGVYPHGHRQYTWPCFTTSIPAEPGMSGGFVFVPEDGSTVGACGVVSADSFSGDARTNQMLYGNSIVACSWPAFGLSIPESMGSIDKSANSSLLDMVLNGKVPKPLGGVSHLRCVSTADGASKIEMKMH